MPRTLAQNAQYINETIKPAIKSAIEAQGVTVPSTDSFLDYADRIGEIEGGGSGYQLKDLPTGSISTVNDAEPLPLNALTVSVDAVQDLHGYDHPWVGGAGSNLVDVERKTTRFFMSNPVFLAVGTYYVIRYASTSQMNSTAMYSATIDGTYNIVPESDDNDYAYCDRIMQWHVGKSIITIKQDCYIKFDCNTNDNSQPYSLMLTQDVSAYNAGSDAVDSDVYKANFKPYSNICPISGLNSGEITVCDDIDNPTQTETTALDFPQTIYGAEWDVVGGGMNKGYGYIEFDGSENWYLESGNNFYTEIISDARKSMTVECNMSPSNRNIYTGNDNVWISSSGRLNFTYNEIDHTLEALQQLLSNTNLQVKYKLATPTTIDLSPLSIRMLQGVNNLYADCGEVIEGEYFVDEGAIDVRKVDYQIGSSGSIKTTDGRVLSGFASMSGYHARPLDASGNWLDVDWSKDFEVCVAFKYTDSGASGITVLFGYNYNSTLNSRFQSPLIYIDKDHSRDLCLEISSNGSSWMVDQSLSYAIDLDTWYALRLKFTLSTLTLDCSISTDFDTWTSLYSNTLSAAPYHSNTSMIGIGSGCQASAWASNGLLVDTFNTYIKGDGVSWGASTEAFPS